MKPKTCQPVHGSCSLPVGHKGQHDNGPTKWEVRSDREVSLSMDPRTGRFAEKVVTRIRYRALTSRGRFKTFVVVGKTPRSLHDLVDAYEAKSKQR